MRMPYARFEVRDVREGLQRLRDVPPELRRKAVQKAVRAGARYLVQQMKGAMRKHFRTGTLAKMLKTRVRYYAKRSVMVVMVGVNSEKNAGTFRGNRITPYRYAHFVTRYRRRFLQECPRKSGRFRWIGANRPDDFVSNATLSGRSAVIAVMKRVIDAY